MALETERCSPGHSPSSPSKPKSAFHQIALLTRSVSPTSILELDPDKPAPGTIFPHSEDSKSELQFDKPSFQTRRVPDNKHPSRPVSNESSSVDKHPYSDSSPPSSPPAPGLELCNGYVADSRIYHPDMASLSLVYGLGVGVVPNRFPLSLHLPTVYPEVDRGFTGLPRVPTTVLPVKAPDTLGVFAGSQNFIDSRLLSSTKPQIASNTVKDGSSCGCCRSGSPVGSGRSPRSPSPSPPPPPGPSALTFSVDNILRPDFGRSKPQASQQSCVRRVRTSKNVIKSPSSSETDTSPATKSTNSDKPDPSSDQEKDSNGQVWPAWVYCTRYSDRPSSGEYPHFAFILSVK